MCEVCVLCFLEDPPGDFSHQFFFFLDPPSSCLSYIRGDRFPQKIYIPRGGNLEDIIMILCVTNCNTYHTYTLLLNTRGVNKARQGSIKPDCHLWYNKYIKAAQKV